MSKQGKLKIIPLGGLGEVGKNMTAYEFDRQIIVVDAGIMFPENDMLGIDYIIPDFSYITARRSKVKGIVITHGHEDHTGAIRHVLADVGGQLDFQFTILSTLDMMFSIGGAVAASLLLGLADTVGKYAAPEYGEFFWRAAIAAARLHRRRRYGLVQVHTLPDPLVFARNEADSRLVLTSGRGAFQLWIDGLLRFSSLDDIRNVIVAEKGQPASRHHVDSPDHSAAGPDLRRPPGRLRAREVRGDPVGVERAVRLLAAGPAGEIVQGQLRADGAGRKTSAATTSRDWRSNRS